MNPYSRLNRTFYGIETYKRRKGLPLDRVLIVPFMELKRRSSIIEHAVETCLNRTFYGIETRYVLQRIKNHSCLNRTFYGIETGRHSLL